MRVVSVGSLLLLLLQLPSWAGALGGIHISPPSKDLCFFSRENQHQRTWLDHQAKLHQPKTLLFVASSCEAVDQMQEGRFPSRLNPLLMVFREKGDLDSASREEYVTGLRDYLEDHEVRRSDIEKAIESLEKLAGPRIEAMRPLGILHADRRTLIQGFLQQLTDSEVPVLSLLGFTAIQGKPITFGWSEIYSDARAAREANAELRRWIEETIRLNEAAELATPTPWISIEDGFSAAFPVKPTRTDATTAEGTGYAYQALQLIGDEIAFFGITVSTVSLDLALESPEELLKSSNSSFASSMGQRPSDSQAHWKAFGDGRESLYYELDFYRGNTAFKDHGFWIVDEDRVIRVSVSHTKGLDEQQEREILGFLDSFTLFSAAE